MTYPSQPRASQRAVVVSHVAVGLAIAATVHVETKNLPAAFVAGVVSAVIHHALDAPVATELTRLGV